MKAIKAGTSDTDKGSSPLGGPILVTKGPINAHTDGVSTEIKKVVLRRAEESEIRRFGSATRWVTECPSPGCNDVVPVVTSGFAPPKIPVHQAGSPQGKIVCSAGGSSIVLPENTRLG